MAIAKLLHTLERPFRYVSVCAMAASYRACCKSHLANADVGMRSQLTLEMAHGPCATPTLTLKRRPPSHL